MPTWTKSRKKRITVIQPKTNPSLKGNIVINTDIVFIFFFLNWDYLTVSVKRKIHKNRMYLYCFILGRIFLLFCKDTHRLVQYHKYVQNITVTMHTNHNKKSSSLTFTIRRYWCLMSYKPRCQHHVTQHITLKSINFVNTINNESFS